MGPGGFEPPTSRLLGVFALAQKIRAPAKEARRPFPLATTGSTAEPQIHAIFVGNWGISP